MAYTELYNRLLIKLSQNRLALEKKCSEGEMLEIFEAWLVSGLLGLSQYIGHDAALALVKDKMGDLPPPRTKPQLVVDNNFPVVDNTELPSDCA